MSRDVPHVCLRVTKQPHGRYKAPRWFVSVSFIQETKYLSSFSGLLPSNLHSTAVDGLISAESHQAANWHDDKWAFIHLTRGGKKQKTTCATVFMPFLLKDSHLFLYLLF